VRIGDARPDAGNEVVAEGRCKIVARGEAPVFAGGRVVHVGRPGVDDSGGRAEQGDSSSYKQLFHDTVADLRSVHFAQPGRVVFRNANFSKVYLLNTDVREIELTSISWPVDGRRLCVYDELAPDRQIEWGRLERLYRELKQNYENRTDHGRAGDFPYREKEARRKNPTTAWNHKLLLGLYKAFSGYSELAWPAMAWLLFVIVGCATLYLETGVEKVISYGVTERLYWTDFSEVLHFSVQTSFLLMPDGYVLNGLGALVNTLQLILSPILIGLLGLQGITHFYTHIWAGHQQG